MNMNNKMDETKQDIKTTGKKADAKLEEMKGKAMKKGHSLSDKM